MGGHRASSFEAPSQSRATAAPDITPEPDLSQCGFTAEWPNHRLAADITRFATDEGELHWRQVFWSISMVGGTSEVGCDELGVAAGHRGDDVVPWR